MSLPDPSVFRFGHHEAPSRPVWSTRVGAVFPRWVSEKTNLREVAPGLYVGNQDAVTHSRKWGLVVDLCGSSKGAEVGKYPRKAQLVRYRLEDGRPIPTRLFEALVPEVGRAIRRGELVLVHCAAGLSRSASVAYALLRVGWGLPHEDALHRVLTSFGVKNGYPMPETFASARRWVDGWLLGEQLHGHFSPRRRVRWTH